MSKRFTVFFIVCLMVVLSGTAVFAAEPSEGGATVSSLLMTPDKAAAMDKADMKDMCNDQTMVMMDKKSMDKMMVMMTVDQFNLMMDNMSKDDMFKDQMTAMGTQDQWLMLSKDQKNAALDKLMLSMNQEQLDTMTDLMMMIMTKDQMMSMMSDNTNAMLTTSNALEPLQNDMMRMSQGQSLMLRDKLSMDRMMKVMTIDQITTLRDSMMMDNTLKDQMLAMATKQQWQAMNKDLIIVTIDQIMMTMTKDQMSQLTEKMMVTMTKDQMTTLMMDNTNTIQKPTTVVGY